ncbi:MAG: YciI family protein [Fimbriimonadaceae bacterium]|nr:YciI family protein [Fimbriimonadaceae bacterium]
MFTKTVLVLSLVAAGLTLPIAPAERQDAKATHALFFFEPSAAFELRTNAKSADYWQRWTAYIGKLQASGKMVGGSGVQAPSTGKWLGKAAGNAPRVGGFVLVNVENLAAAEALAKDCPAIADGGAVEIRPILPMNEGSTK